MTDQISQFNDYENDYYTNGHYEQEDGWANYTIDEDWASYEASYKEAPEANDDVDANHAIEQVAYHCHQCPEAFTSNNALHKHVQADYNHSLTKASTVLGSKTELKSAYPAAPNGLVQSNKKIVWSNAMKVSAKGYGFQGWRYATIQARLSQDSQTSPICLNTDCTASLINWGFLKEHAPTAVVKKMASSMKVQGLGSSSHEAGDYVELDLYFPANHGRTAVIH